MKTILYMAITADGFIAKADDSSDFLTPEESASYVDTVTRAGNLIIGRRTYEVLSQQPEFQKFKEAGVKIVVVSRTDFKTLNADEIIVRSPKEALEQFAGEDTVIVAGGGNLNGSFLKEDLIDELYLDIAFVFFSGVAFEAVVSNQGFYIPVELLSGRSVEFRAVRARNRAKKARDRRREATKSRKGQRT